MINKRFALAPAAMLFVGFLCALPASAQAPACYTLESMQGSFATIGTYGPGIAMALAVRNHDALGNLSATAINNLPRAGSTTGERTVVGNSNAGTFAVNCDGSGVVTRIATLADGTWVQGFDDFLITEGDVENGKLVATTIVDGSRALSSIVPGGGLPVASLHPAVQPTGIRMLHAGEPARLVRCPSLLWG